MKKILLTLALMMPIAHFLDMIRHMAYEEKFPVHVIVIGIICAFALFWTGYIAASKILEPTKPSISNKGRVLSIEDIMNRFYVVLKLNDKRYYPITTPWSKEEIERSGHFKVHDECQSYQAANKLSKTLNRA